MLYLFISVIRLKYDYHVGYRMKIKLICRLTKSIDHDIHSTKVLFSVSISEMKNVNIKGRESIASENL